jgi:hypothetical protein
MTEQEKIILQDLVEQVRQGTLDIETLPQVWKDRVQERLSEGA